MQLTLRYGVLCVRLWTSELGETTKRRSPPRGNTKVDSRQTDLNVFYPPQVPSNVCCRFFFCFQFFFFFFTLPKKKKTVFVKHLCILKSTYCSAHLWRKRKKTKQKKQPYLSVFTGEGLLHRLLSIPTKVFFSNLAYSVSFPR